ncbi:MAG: hypothetical protein KDB77_08345 [Flavobacteriales bacterium]|nr:hypothetical protein [Flavobacteriales bacterium]
MPFAIPEYQTLLRAEIELGGDAPSPVTEPVAPPVPDPVDPPATDPVDPPTTDPVVPPARPTVRTKAVRGGDRLRIDVNPDRAADNYVVKIQKQRSAGRAATTQVRAKRWVTVRKVRSKGAKDVVTVNLPKGRYRVLVPAQYGMAKQTSKAVRIRR